MTSLLDLSVSASSLKLNPKLVALSPLPNLVNEKETLLPGILGIMFLSSSFKSMTRESLIPWSEPELSWFLNGGDDVCIRLSFDCSCLNEVTTGLLSMMRESRIPGLESEFSSSFNFPKLVAG